MPICCNDIKLMQIVRAHANRIMKRNQELRDKRMAICNSCELLKNGWCRACNCLMDAKTRLTDKNIKCEHPEGAKW